MPRGYCAHIAFASAPALNALTSPLDGTPWPVFQNVRVDPAPQPFGCFVAFRPHATCGRMVSGSLHFPSRVLCSFHSRYYCAIGLKTCLEFEHGAPNSHAISNACYSEDSPSPSTVPLQDYHPLWCSVPGDFRFGGWGGQEFATPHFHMITRADSDCSVPSSIAFTEGISVDFFSSAY